MLDVQVTAETLWARPVGEVRQTLRCILHPRESFWSKLLFLAGLSYLFVPWDIIPDRLAYVGHLDEAGFVLSGLVGARIAASHARRAEARAALAGPDAAPMRRADLLFWVRVIRADLGNFFMLQYRGVDGFLITGKNSGTHWLKYMLSCGIAHQYGVPAPTRTSGPDADAIIGHPREERRHYELPRFGSSHTIPSAAFSWRLLSPLLLRAPVVLLVRDIQDAMLSNYVKWQDSYGVPFDTYAEGDPSARRFVADIWWYVHFFNRWGDIARARPDLVMVVHYEDVQQAPAYWVRKAAAHLGVTLSDEAVAAAVAAGERGRMKAALDPAKGETIIPTRAARARVTFSAAALRSTEAVMARHLRHDLGYGYAGSAVPSAVNVPGASQRIA